jgi:acyl carrier protein
MNCPFCEAPLAPGTTTCPHCGTGVAKPSPAGMEPYDIAPRYGPGAPRNSNLAVVSLISGILSWFVLPIVGAIVAVVTGHMARAEIRARQGRLSGDGFAVVGLVLGYLHLVLMVLILLAILAFVGAFATWAAKQPTKPVIRPPQVVRTRPGDGDVDGRVIEIVGHRMGVTKDRVTPETSLTDDLKADDLDRAELVMELEEAFRITITDEEMDALTTVGQLIELIKARQGPARDGEGTRHDPPGDEPPGKDPQSPRCASNTPSPRARASCGIGPGGGSLAAWTPRAPA